MIVRLIPVNPTTVKLPITEKMTSLVSSHRRVRNIESLSVTLVGEGDPPFEIPPSRVEGRLLDHIPSRMVDRLLTYLLVTEVYIELDPRVKHRYLYRSKEYIQRPNLNI